MKPFNYLQLALAAIFLIFALGLPVTAPAWLFAMSLGVAALFGLTGACKLCNVFDDDGMFRLSPAKLEDMRSMHRRGDG